MVKPTSRLIAMLVLLIVCALPLVATATTYLFEVPSMIIDVRPQTDGNTHIEYAITFKNLSSDALDIVDIGLPHGKYDLSTFAASFNTVALPTIRNSQYVKPGVEIPLSGHELRQNRSGVLRVAFTMPKMVYYDDKDDQYTSLEFGNTFFGSDFVRGAMNLTMRYHFPPEVTNEETRWHREEPTTMKRVGDHYVFTWVHQGASPSAMIKHGIGFPAKYMAEGAIVKPSYCLDCLVAFFGLLATLLPLLIPIGVIALFIYLRFVVYRRRMKRYLPPTLGIEGAGAKRGLTAPEAAVALELEPNRVLTMILFGLVKKEAVKIVSPKPLKLKKVEPTPKDLLAYELQFIEAIKRDGTVREPELRKMFIALIKRVDKKLQGFSRQETRAYYKNVMNTAWQAVRDAATPDLGVAFAERAEWLMIDDEFGDKTAKTFRDRDIIVMPRWYGTHWHGSTVAAGSSGNVSLPGADFANTFTNAVSNFSNTVVDSVSAFTNSITSATNPPPVSTGSSGGSRGGGGCACACACAGCACACAGGGR